MPIVLWRDGNTAPVQLLDGRNRLDAIEMCSASGRYGDAEHHGWQRNFIAGDEVIVATQSVDPYPTSSAPTSTAAI